VGPLETRRHVGRVNWAILTPMLPASLRLFPALLLAAALAPQSALAAPDCSQIQKIQLPDIRFTQVTAEDSHCEAEGVIGSEIGFIIALPPKTDWNGKLLMTGGSYSSRGFGTALKRGYAAVMTDTGHRASGVRADWARGHVERLVNYGYLGVHRTAVTAKAVLAQFYGNRPDYSYFTGCSNGGRQALMEAQRFPQDFNGIIAGAPAHNFSRIMAAFAYNMQRIFPDPDDPRHPVVTPDNLRLLQSSILEQCDASDGVSDNILNDPRTCDFSLNRLPLCPGGEPAAHCLTVAQREAIAAVYEGPRNQDGPIFRGFPLGGESERGGWDGWITGPNASLLNSYNEPSLQFAFGTQAFKHLVFEDPDWDYTAYDFTTFEQDAARLRSVADAVDPNLTGFKAAGGKLILWHGWADPALTALASVDYYEAARSADPAIDETLRLFLLPGVLHCSGGPGPSRVDWLSAIENWVEKDQAPETLTAARIEDGQTTMTRPLCVHPQRAHYRGEGDVNKAANFECRAP